VTARPQVRIDEYGRVWAKGASEIFSADADDWIDGWCVADADAVVVDDAFVAQFASAAVLTEDDAEELARMWWDEFDAVSPQIRETWTAGAREAISRLIAAREGSS